MALVKFFTCTQSQYDALFTGDPKVFGGEQGNLYFTSDTKRLYKGDTLYGGSFEYVSTLPVSGNTETLYFAADTGNISVWNGSKFVTKFLPFETTLTNTDDTVPTSKAVKTYVDTVSGALDNALSAAIQTLDAAEVGGSGKVITTISEADGIISATAIDLTASAVKRDEGTYVHATTVETALEEIGAVIDVISGDASTAGSIKKAAKDLKDELSGAIGGGFDSTKTVKAYIDAASGSLDGALSAAIQTLDVETIGTAGQFIQSISETDGKISATAIDLTTSNVSRTATANVAATSAEGAIVELGDAIHTISGDAETAGSFAKAIKEASDLLSGAIGASAEFNSTNTVKAYIDAETTAREADTTFLSGAIGEGYSSANTVKAAIEAIQNAAISVSGAANNAIEVTSSGEGNVNKTIGLKINANDKFLSQTSDGLSATFTLVKAISGEANFEDTTGEIAAEYYIADKNGTQVGARISIAKDQFLQSARFVQGSGSGDDQLELTFNRADGSQDVVNIPLSGLFDEYTPGPGIAITPAGTGIEISGVVDNSGEFLTVGPNGFKVSGVTTAIDTAKNALSSAIGTDATSGEFDENNTVVDYINSKIQTLSSETATLLSAKLDDVTGASSGEIIVSDGNNKVESSGKAIGGATLAATPDSSTVATEAAVKTYVDNALTGALVWNTL